MVNGASSAKLSETPDYVSKLLSLLLWLASTVGLLAVSDFGVDFEVSEADAIIEAARNDPAQLHALMSLSESVSIPRLSTFVGARQFYPEQHAVARKLLTSIPNWANYYQWRLAKVYPYANPTLLKHGNAPFIRRNDVPRSVVEARQMMQRDFERIAALDMPGSIPLIAPYLVDKGFEISGGDYIISSVRSAASRALSDYFVSKTGKFNTTDPAAWLEWWNSNQTAYPQLPENPVPPVLPTPKAKAVPQATPAVDPMGKYWTKRIQEHEDLLRSRKAAAEEKAASSEPRADHRLPAAAVIATPPQGEQVAVDKQRLWIVAASVLLTGVITLLLLRKPKDAK